MEFVPPLVPQCDCKLSAESLPHPCVMILVKMRNDLCIAVCKEAVALRDKFFAPLHVIEEFTVVDHENAVIFVRHRLLALGEIDDAQPSRGEGNPATFQKTFLIRSPVVEGARHSLHDPRRRWSLSSQIYDSCDAAHDLVRMMNRPLQLFE